MKVDRTELVYKLVEAINSCADKKEPAEHMIAMGTALAKIGQLLKGVSLQKAKAVIQTVHYMNEAGLMDVEDEPEISSTAA